MAVGTGLAASRRRVGPIEERSFRSVNGLPDGLAAPVWLVMQFGSFASIFATAALARRRMPPVRLIVVGVSVWAGCKALKRLVGRGRPAEHLSAVQIRGEPAVGGGYPSGHTAVSAALALSLARPDDPVSVLGWSAVAGTVGLARMYVGAHLPLDLVGGAAIGFVAARLGDR